MLMRWALPFLYRRKRFSKKKIPQTTVHYRARSPTVRVIVKHTRIILQRENLRSDWTIDITCTAVDTPSVSSHTWMLFTSGWRCCCFCLTAAVAEWLARRTPWSCWRHGVRKVVSSIPGRGNILGWVFHPTRWLERFSLIWICLSFQILNLFRTLSSWGSIFYIISQEASIFAPQRLRF